MTGEKSLAEEFAELFGVPLDSLEVKGQNWPTALKVDAGMIFAGLAAAYESAAFKERVFAAIAITAHDIPFLAADASAEEIEVAQRAFAADRGFFAMRSREALDTRERYVAMLRVAIQVLTPALEEQR